jgi:hypothetical protein
MAAASGDSLLVIGALLGHRDARTTQRYVHLGADPIRSAADRASSRVAEALTGNRGEAEVVTIRNRRRKG